MKKLFLSLLLLPLWGAGGFAAVQVKNISTDYANKRVTFALSWAVGTRDATHLSKVWVLVDYQAVTNPNTTGAWQRATVVSATATTGTVSGNTGHGFFLQGTDGAFSSTVTVTLSGVPAKFNWCATATDYPPNAVMSNGTYTLKGTTPFTINGSATVNARTYTGACITSITDPTGCPGIVTNPAFNTGTIASTGQTLCIGGTPSNIGSSAAATGGNGTISYQWYKNGTAISSATATTYTPPTGDATAAATHTYTRRAKDATCNTTLTASSGSWVLKITALSTQDQVAGSCGCAAGLTSCNGYCRDLSNDAAVCLTCSSRGTFEAKKQTSGQSQTYVLNQHCPSGWRWPTPNELRCMWTNRSQLTLANAFIWSNATNGYDYDCDCSGYTVLNNYINQACICDRLTIGTLGRVISATEPTHYPRYAHCVR